LLGVVTILLCVDVAVRYAQVMSITWIGDVAAVSLYLMTFLAAPWVLREGGHIAVDSLIRILPAGAQRMMGVLVSVIGASICALLFVYAVRVLMASFAANTQVYKTIIYPQWWLFILPPVTFGLLSVIFLRQTRGGAA
jgi:TRAP-type C4-dicarboxylate transport system permease small subunit